VSPIRSFDVAVVGGSIAGSAVACALLDLGLSVAIIEREASFRDKARGEGIHPWGIDEAEDLGLRPVLEAAGSNPLPIWHNYASRAPLEPTYWADQSSRGNVEHGVFHPALQQRFLDHARGNGAYVLRPAAAQSLEHRPGGIELNVDGPGAPEPILAKVAIGADGTNSLVRSLVQIKTNRDKHHHWFAGLLIDGFAGDPTAAHAGLLPGGRFFVLPQGHGRARIYAALMPDRAGEVRGDKFGTTLVATVAACLPSAMLDDARPAGPQGVFNNADVWPDARTAEGVVLVGDAAGTNDPSIGHGISLALRDARELRDAIRTHGLGQEALEAYAAERDRYYGTLREYAIWMAALWVEEGAEADARRARFRAAREADPESGGFNMITALGPRDLIADDAARIRFFGDGTSVEQTAS
jgi:2-polyprenyl-6-methoxyphenol hydroxylase-like FAD-dependent oxidoreductase